jgi:hypothetical protein
MAQLAMDSCVSSRHRLPRVNRPTPTVAKASDHPHLRPPSFLPHRAPASLQSSNSLFVCFRIQQLFDLVSTTRSVTCVSYPLNMASIVEKQLQSLLDGFDALRLEYQRVYSRCAVLEAQMVTAKSQVSPPLLLLRHLTLLLCDEYV